MADKADLVNKQFAEEEAEGLMQQITLGEGLARFGDLLTIAAIGAIERRTRARKCE